MQTDTVAMPGDSPGTQRTLVAQRFGVPGARPKVYLQAGLHADEMPGVLILQHLRGLLLRAEAAGLLTGEVVMVPVANVIGLAQWLHHKPLGRYDTESSQNFNRMYPDLAELAGEELEGLLTGDAAQNLAIVRAAFGRALAGAVSRSDLEEQRLALLRWSQDADYVLDLHCDHHAVLHLYAAPARPADTSLLCRSTGAVLALIEEVSGGNAFDEAHTAPWAALKRRFAGRYPIPDGCFSSTLEYRGQFDVDEAVAASDAANLMVFLGAVGVVAAQAVPQFADAPHWPLGGALEAFAPMGGVLTWDAAPGRMVSTGEVLAQVTDPVTGTRVPVLSPCDGMLFRQELWPMCLRGQGLCHVAGETILKQGELLGD